MEGTHQIGSVVHGHVRHEFKRLLDVGVIGITVLAFHNEQQGAAFPMHSTLYQTADGGASWSGLKVPEDCVWGQDIEFAPDDPASVWLADHDKLYFSDDSGKSWEEQLEARCRDLVMVDRHHGYLLADDAVYYTSNGGITHVVEQPPFVPETTRLFQNYPNPFNPVTHFNYQVPSPGKVRIAIYNLNGQLIRTIVDGHQLSGNYAATWDGKSDDGNSVVTGVYLVRMEAGNQVASRKILYLK